MATSVQFRPHNRDLGMVMREVDEDLAIFLGMKNGAEPKPDSLLISNGLGEEAFLSLADDSLLNLETSNNDHDWLLAQQDAAANQADASSGECVSLSSEQMSKPNNLGPSAPAANRSPLSSGGRKPSSSRAATPTRRPTLAAAKSKPSRASTPTSRVPAAAAKSSKPVAAPVRTSTPSRVSPRSSTPTSRTTVPTASSKPASTYRASTPAARSVSAAPMRKPAMTSTTSSKSPSEGTSSRGKTSSIVTKNPVATRGGSSSRASNPSEMLSMSHDASKSLKTSVPNRPASASRGRPSSLSYPSKGKPKQKSCSPTKARATNGNAHRNGSATLSRSWGYGRHGDDDDVNPVLMGTKMVERVVNSRKLAPPKQDEHISLENPKRSSHENSGFGRSLSKKSLDMAIRHMDIRRSVNAAGSLKPVATTTVLSYFSNGNQSSSSQSSSFGVSESPVTSSSDSSKSSNCINSYFS
ncbi:cell wall protein DAN4-like isoform X1 [Salvia splendens]|uniref:cell wall protein DAN4-like isoform X1 n=1 Tax=Salvia splendens TaxID=180675 RepID=UPI001C2803AD|nr:cell wall protein DAN4-like isoform X1 [Salvia splendens]